MAKDVGRRTGGPLLDLDSMILGLLILGVRWVEGICACIAKNAKWLTLKLIYCFILHTHTHIHENESSGFAHVFHKNLFYKQDKVFFSMFIAQQKVPLEV